MPNFVSTSSLLRKKYEEKKGTKVRVSPDPVSDICNHCWYRSLCLVRTLLRQPPRTCCVYELFGTRGTKEATLEEVVKFTCDTRCTSRREWEVDPCPHNEYYCDNHCPVSKYIRDQPASHYQDVPFDDFG